MPKFLNINNFILIDDPEILFNGEKLKTFYLKKTYLLYESKTSNTVRRSRWYVASVYMDSWVLVLNLTQKDEDIFLFTI